MKGKNCEGDEDDDDDDDGVDGGAQNQSIMSSFVSGKSLSFNLLALMTNILF